MVIPNINFDTVHNIERFTNCKHLDMTLCNMRNANSLKEFTLSLENLETLKLDINMPKWHMQKIRIKSKKLRKLELRKCDVKELHTETIEDVILDDIYLHSMKFTNAKRMTLNDVICSDTYNYYDNNKPIIMKSLKHLTYYHVRSKSILYFYAPLLESIKRLRFNKYRSREDIDERRLRIKCDNINKGFTFIDENCNNMDEFIKLNYGGCKYITLDIDYIRDEELSKFNNVEYLDISVNKIDNIDIFKSFSNLRVLKLRIRNNDINSLAVFKYCDKLERLYLDIDKNESKKKFVRPKNMKILSYNNIIIEY